MLKTITFLLFSQLAVGGLLSISMVPDQAGKSFFRFCSIVCAVLFAIALLVIDDLIWVPRALLILALIASTGSALLVVTERQKQARIGFYVSTAIGLIALLTLGYLHDPLDLPLWTLIASAIYLVVGAVFLGSIIFSMTLGHWYLNVPTLSIAPLRSLTKLMIVSTIAKAILLGIVLCLGTASKVPHIAETIDSFSRLSGLFFWARVLFGLIGPAVVCYMTWETVKLNATQSATGLLYVNTILVLLGETLSLFLYHTTRLPV